MMTPDFLLQLALAIGSGCAVYAGIKTDLARSIVIAEQAKEDAKNAHQRIDDHVDKHHTRIFHGGQ